MKRFIYLFFILLCIFSCQKKQDTINNDTLPDKEKENITQKVDWIDGSVERESGDLFMYLEKRDEYYKLNPDKATGSFNMWELKYYLDLKVDGNVYKDIEIFVDTNAPNVQYISRDVGQMCFAIKTGTKVKIEKQAWEKIVSKKQKRLYPKEIAIH